MKVILLGALSAAVSLLTACGGAPARTANPPNIFDRPPSASERVRQGAVRDALTAKLTNGMTYRFAGTATHVVIAHGSPAAIDVGPGTRTYVRLVKGTAPRFALSLQAPDATRKPAEFQPGDGGGDDGPPDSEGSPAAVPTAPPNVGACQAAGGAAWGDANGNYGCLGSGSSRQMSCGVWSWLSPGRGRLTLHPTPDSTETVDGVYITDNGQGACGIG